MLGAYVRKVLGRVFRHIGNPLGDLGRGCLSNGDCERRMKGAVRMTRCLWRGSVCMVMREGISVFGAQLGKLEWAHLPGTLRGG